MSNFCPLAFPLIETLPRNEKGLAFHEYDGSALTHIERKICKATGAIGYNLPNSTTYRKELEIRNKRLEGPNEGGRVSRSLTHSIGTATLYYQAPSQTDSISTYMTIQSLINGREGRSPDIGQDGAEGPMTHTSVRSKGKSKASNSTPEQRQISPQSVPQVRRV